MLPVRPESGSPTSSSNRSGSGQIGAFYYRESDPKMQAMMRQTIEMQRAVWNTGR